MKGQKFPQRTLKMQAPHLAQSANGIGFRTQKKNGNKK